MVFLTPSPPHITAVVLTTMLTGCNDEGCDVPLRELSMIATVVDSGPVVRAEVDFASGERSGLSIPYRRCPSDRILINGTDAHETSKTERIEYSLTGLAEVSPREYRFELLRDGDPPTVATVTLPEPFTVTFPGPESALPQAEDTQLRWEPPAPADEMRILLFEEIGGGLCLTTPLEDHDYKATIGVRVADEGSWIVPAGAVTSPSGVTCDARFEFKRYSYGSYPATLDPDGFLEGSVVRSVDFLSSPG